MDFRKNFSEKIYLLRKSKNISLIELGEKLEITDEAVRLLEKGKRSPSFEVLLALANYFDVPLDYLVGQGIFADWDQILEHWDTVIGTIGKVYVSSSQKPTAFSELIQAYSDFVKGDKIKIGVFLSMLVSKIEIKTESDGTVNISFQWKFE